ncbi:MAG: phospholipase A [Gammaproteobacteria bacterium]|nr:phospholipase A [Gammaproteobacteria bacterium]
MRRTSLLLLLLQPLLNTVKAELLAVPDQVVASAGEPIDLQVYAHADAVIVAATDFPQHLAVRFSSDDGAVIEATALLQQQTQLSAVPSASYRVTVPAEVQGMLEIQIVDTAGDSRSKPAYVLINDIRQPQSLAAAETAAAEQAEQGSEMLEDAASQTPLVQVASAAENIDEEADRNPFLDNFFAYEPVYFIAGGSPSNAKFQLSFKYRFLHPDTDIAVSHPWLTGIYMAYSQTSFWDLSSESVPFTDTNFEPELFYQFNDMRFSFLPDSASADLRTGIRHESNGEDEDRSRSLTTAYLEPAMHFELGEDYLLSLTPRIWAYVGRKRDNSDIRRFRGNNSLSASIGKRDSWQLETMLRGNIGTGRGALQMDLSYPVNQLIPGLDLYLYSQFFTGYGENLLNYNVKDTRLRFGIGILR